MLLDIPCSLPPFFLFILGHPFIKIFRLALLIVQLVPVFVFIIPILPYLKSAEWSPLLLTLPK
jgi:hypothetical protein